MHKRALLQGPESAAVARVALIAFALGLAACPSEGPPAYLGTVLMIELDAFETVHVTLTANAAAVAEANRGLQITAIGPSDSTASFRVIPDDARLDDAAWSNGAIGGRGARVGLRGGDLTAVCASGVDCVIGVTIEALSADRPTVIALDVGLARAGSAGIYGCGAEEREFTAAATASGASD